MSLRILLVTHYFADHGGGVEIVAHQLARRLGSMEHRLTWCATGPTQLEPTANVSLVPMNGLNCTERWLGVPYPVWWPTSLWRLVRHLRKADVVHLHDCLYAGNAIAALFCVMLRKPYIVTQHLGLVPYKSIVLRSLMSIANSTLGSFVLSRSSRVVFISKAAQQYFSEFVAFSHTPWFVPNGVDASVFSASSSRDRVELRRELGWSTERPACLFVGRFVEKKGLPIVRELATRLPECDWKLVGWGPVDPHQWSLPNVDVLGKRTQAEIAQYYAAADVLVLPSIGEGFPLVIQEALAAGLHCLVTDSTVAADPEVVAVVVALPLVSDAWIEALRSHFTATKEQVEERRSVARRFAERWSWSETATRYGKLLNDVVGSSHLSE